MESLKVLAGAMGALPDWALFAVPACILLYALATVLFGGRRAYPYLSFLLLAVAVLFSAGRGSAERFFYLGLCAAVAAGAGLAVAFLRPHGRERELPAAAEPSKTRRTVRIGDAKAGPPVYIPASECGIDMAHARSCLAKLRRAPLTAGDRIEADVLTRTLERADRAALTEEEIVRANDALAATIKLAAKYKV